jgi:hypothetical protein
LVNGGNGLLSIISSAQPCQPVMWLPLLPGLAA